MPRTAAEVQQLLDQLKAARDQMDQDADQQADAKEQAATTLEAQATQAEAQIPALRQSINFGRDPRDEAGRQQDADQIRALQQQAARDKQQAAKERMNAARMRSLKHDKERASDREVCVHCVGHTDDQGDIVGATHVRHPIEDVDVLDDQGAVVRTAPGLKTLFADDRAEIDPQDGKLIIDGRKVGG